MILLPATLALSACAVAPLAPSYGYGYGYGYDAGPAWVEPAPYSYYQAVPVSPYVGGVWIDGSWTEVRGRREWQPGHWVAPHWGNVRGEPSHRGDGRYADDRRHRPPRADIGDRGDQGDGRRGGGWNSTGRGNRGETRQVPEFPGAVFDAGSRTDPRITPP